MHTSLQRQQEIKIDIVNKELSNNAWYETQGNGHWIWVTKNKGGQKNHTVVFNWIQCLGFQYTVFFFVLFFFFPTFHALKTYVVRVFEGKWYRNDLKGSKNYFELAGGSSYLESTVFYSKWRLYVRRRHIPGINIALLITYWQESSCYFGHRTQMNLMSFS